MRAFAALYRISAPALEHIMLGITLTDTTWSGGVIYKRGLQAALHRSRDRFE